MLITIQAPVKAEHAQESEAAIQRMVAALEREQPEGVRYASLKLADGVTFVALVEFEDAESNPLFALPEYQQLLAKLEGWRDGPPQVSPATIVGSYRLLASAVAA